MAPIQKSGLAYPNKFGLILVRALEEVMGRNGLNAILNLGGLSHYIEHPLPDNLEKGFDFAEVAAVNLALEDMYGPRGGRGLSLRVGRAIFADGLRNFGALAGVGDLALLADQRPAQHGGRKRERIRLHHSQMLRMHRAQRGGQTHLLHCGWHPPGKPEMGFGRQ